MSATDALAAFIEGTAYDDLPDDVIEHSKRLIRDNVGVALAGSAIPIGDLVSEYVGVTNPGEYAVMGRGSAGIEAAAFANGVYAHAMDWDDTTATHLTHPTSPTLPAALAAAEREGATGRQLIAAHVVGCEVHYRVGKGCSYPEHYLEGWHYTGTLGVFGATAAAASILGLPREEVRNALGIAASSSAGLRKNNGSHTKPYHAGDAAQRGVRAAVLAEAGFTSDDDIFEGELGYGEVYSPREYEPEHITEPLGEEWSILDVGFKLHPGGTINDGAQVALKRLLEREGLAAEDVARVAVTLDDIASDLLIHHDPEDHYQGGYSIEFPIAAILREREHGVEQFTEAFATHPKTREAIGKVERDFGFEGEEYDVWSARVRVETTGGEEYVEEELYSPLQPGEERLREKFYTCAGNAIDREAAEAIDDAVADLESEGAVGRLLDAVRG